MNHAPRALLVLAGRSELAFHQLHGEPLYAHALRALDAALGGVEVVVDDGDADRVRRESSGWGVDVRVDDLGSWWEAVQESAERPLLVHDALCPLVTADFIGTVLARSREVPGAAVAAVRAVTDTLKAVVDGRIEGTIDRDQLVTVTSPVLVPAAVLAAADEPLPLLDGAALVAWLRARGAVELVRAPSLGRRIQDVRAVRLLESLDEVGHRVRAGAGHVPPVPSGPSVPSVTEDRA